MTKVFYRAEQSVQTDSYSPSSAKPSLVVQDWLSHGYINQDDVMSFEPVTREDLYLAHDRNYVDGVLDGTTKNGFGNTDKGVAAALPYTTGSMLAAAEYALLHRTITCSPTSGFHHAHHDYGHGFCTFNGLMVTALKLKQQGLVHSVGIIDCDQHYGDGTAGIIKTLGLQSWVRHHTVGSEGFINIPADRRAFFEWLDDAIKDVSKCDIVLYQAGADCSANDPLGGFMLDRDFAQREQMVVDGLHGVPTVWNLAGGYQRDAKGTIAPVLSLHRYMINIVNKEVSQ